MTYEERYIFMLLTSVINQTEVKTLRREVDWDKVLKISDFHNIVSAVYFGMLGVDKDVSEECAERFYQKYKRELLLGESYKDAEKTIRWQLARNKIHAVLLMGNKLNQYYPKKEMGHTDALEFLVGKKDLARIHRLMIDMDYEQKENRVGEGTIYIRTPGIRVVFYDELPFGNRVLKKAFPKSVMKYRCMAGQKFLHVLGKEEEYLYINGKLVEAYIAGELKIRSILHAWQYRKQLGDDFDWDTVFDVWEKAEFQEFMNQVGTLARIWFEEAPGKDSATALRLEDYILSRGKENRDLDAVLIPHERVRLDFYNRNREQEWSKREREWLFPKRIYMVQLFPTLKKHPTLLGYFWLVRLCRMIKGRWSRRFRAVILAVSEKWMELKEKRRKKREEVPETERAEEIPEQEIPADATCDGGDMEVEAEEAERVERELQEKESEENEKDTLGNDENQGEDFQEP